jgi:hypothetical protein
MVDQGTTGDGNNVGSRDQINSSLSGVIIFLGILLDNPQLPNSLAKLRNKGEVADQRDVLSPPEVSVLRMHSSPG